MVACVSPSVRSRDHQPHQQGDPELPPPEESFGEPPLDRGTHGWAEDGATPNEVDTESEAREHGQVGQR